MGIVIDEYIRLIGSVKTAFQQRQKAYHAWHSAEQELQKRKTNQDKLLRQGRSQQDRLNQLSADVADAERKVHQARLLFDDMGRLMRNELERFEREKVEDFKSGVETFLESAVEAQKEVRRVSSLKTYATLTHASSLRYGRPSSCNWTPRKGRLSFRLLGLSLRPTLTRRHRMTTLLLTQMWRDRR
jgi:chromosome segregation ATPase